MEEGFDKSKFQAVVLDVKRDLKGLKEIPLRFF